MNDLDIKNRGDKDYRRDYIREDRIELKRPLHEKLNDDVAEFLANGGKVTEIPTNPYIPRQPCPNPEPYPKRKNPKPFYDHKYNKLLRKWLTEVDGRAKNLAAESGYSDSWLSARRHGFNQLLVVDYDILKPAMDRIENHEKLKRITAKHLGKGYEEKAQ